MLDHPSYCSLVAVIVWQLSRVQFFAIPWTVAHQAPLSTGDKNTGVDCHFFLQEIFSRDRTWVSCTASRFFTIWATKEEYGGGVTQ